jgi:asparagine synthase (glutamine-hydrolysing)
VDSAAVVSALRAGGEQAPSTFTIGFPGFGDELDESAVAAESARLLGTNHHLEVMGEIDFPGLVAGSVARLEEPCGSPSAPALLQLSRFTAQSVKVVLSGQGADEPLGGYRRAQAAAALGLLEHVPAAVGGPVRAAAGLLPRNERIKRAAGVLGTPPGLDRLLSIFEISSPALRTQLLPGAGDEARVERRDLATQTLAGVADRALLDKALYLDTHLFLPDHLLLYGDKMSMAYGLEHRVPFLDVELMRFVERIPGRLRMRRGSRKWLYRQSVRTLVPEQVLARPKRAFTTPYDEWFRTSLARDLAQSFAPGSPVSEHVDAPTVLRLVDEHRRGRADHKRLLYCLLEFSYWHETFLEGAPRPASLSAA